MGCFTTRLYGTHRLTCRSISHDELWRVEEAFIRILGLVSAVVMKNIPEADLVLPETPPLQAPLRSCKYLPPPRPVVRTDSTRMPQYNDLLLQALSVRGYTGCILWSQDTQDGFQVPADQSKRVFDQSNGGDIILGHSVYGSTANDVVPYGINLLKGRGYELVAVDTCLGSQGSWPYEWIGQPQSGGWQC